MNAADIEMCFRESKLEFILVLKGTNYVSLCEASTSPLRHAAMAVLSR